MILVLALREPKKVAKSASEIMKVFSRRKVIVLPILKIKFN